MIDTVLCDLVPIGFFFWAGTIETSIVGEVYASFAYIFDVQAMVIKDYSY